MNIKEKVRLKLPQAQFHDLQPSSPRQVSFSSTLILAQSFLVPCLSVSHRTEMIQSASN